MPSDLEYMGMGYRYYNTDIHNAYYMHFAEGFRPCWWSDDIQAILMNIMPTVGSIWSQSVSLHMATIPYEFVNSLRI